MIMIKNTLKSDLIQMMHGVVIVIWSLFNDNNITQK